jgi:hypothetical protein
MEEPCAGKLLARVCGGAGRQRTALPVTSNPFYGSVHLLVRMNIDVVWNKLIWKKKKEYSLMTEHYSILAAWFSPILS